MPEWEHRSTCTSFMHTNECEVSVGFKESRETLVGGAYLCEVDTATAAHAKTNTESFIINTRPARLWSSYTQTPKTTPFIKCHNINTFPIV